MSYKGRTPARLRQSQKEREREREREKRGGGRWKGRVIVASQQRAKWRIMVHERGNS